MVIIGKSINFDQYKATSLVKSHCDVRTNKTMTMMVMMMMKIVVSQTWSNNYIYMKIYS